MGRLKTLFRLMIKDRRRLKRGIARWIGICPVFRILPDKLYLKILYRLRIGHKLDLKDPKTYNAKLQWLKLYNRRPEYSRLVDKAEVKGIVAEKLGQEYVIPTLGVWDRVENIDVDSLPRQFVLKCTHDSGSVLVCRDKDAFDFDVAREKLRQNLKKNMFWWGREWPYKAVAPRIIAEAYLEAEEQELRDYKLMCFNGQVRCSFICSDRFSKKGLHVTFFDRQWQVMPFCRHYPNVPEGFPKPQGYEKMVELAELLSRDMPSVRVDFYEVGGRIYFGEVTFFPGCGFEEFTPESWDETLGSWITLPEKKET